MIRGHCAPTDEASAAGSSERAARSCVSCAREAALEALLCGDPAAKTSLTLALRDDLRRGAVSIASERIFKAPSATLPGRPARPVLLPPQHVPKRRLGSLEGRAALVHAIAHIEFNAINLALDIVWRFPNLPESFYRDWLNVAAEEALHFTFLLEHLRTLGYDYGDFPAHNGLWNMAEKTADDLLARLALVPRTLEARGLDVNPGIRAKLAAAGDTSAAAILDRILADEIGHVQIGNYWYRWACTQAGLDPIAAYAELTVRHQAPRLKAPFNHTARLQAGFTQSEIDWLEQLSATVPPTP